MGRGGVVFGNGLGEYDQSPTDPHNKGILAAVQGIQNEHYAAFEQVSALAALDRQLVCRLYHTVPSPHQKRGVLTQMWCTASLPDRQTRLPITRCAILPLTPM